MPNPSPSSSTPLSAIPRLLTRMKQGDYEAGRLFWQAILAWHRDVRDVAATHAYLSRCGVPPYPNGRLRDRIESALLEGFLRVSPVSYDETAAALAHEIETLRQAPPTPAAAPTPSLYPPDDVPLPF